MKNIIFFSSVIAIFFLSGCDDQTSANSLPSRLQTVSYDRIGNFDEAYIVKDKNTNNEFLVIKEVDGGRVAVTEIK